MWSTLPQSPHSNCSQAVVSGLLTAIGGRLGINQLFSLTGEGKWVERFPPMPTKRYGTAAVCSGKSLVVAGGSEGYGKPLHIVEVMDTETLYTVVHCQQSTFCTQIRISNNLPRTHLLAGV